jgi:hypothetical protein
MMTQDEEAYRFQGRLSTVNLADFGAKGSRVKGHLESVSTMRSRGIESCSLVIIFLTWAIP